MEASSVTGEPMLSPLEVDYLAELTKSIGKKTTFVELGTWTGESASVIGLQASIYGGHLYCIDHWLGNEGTELEHIAKELDIFHMFQHNMELLKIWDYVIPIKKSSLSAVSLFADQSIDFLFMDADHRYKSFMQDLKVWAPKLKKGGLLCGHDCEGRYYTYPENIKKFIDSHLGIDFTGEYHAGVIKGLYDFFNDEYFLIPGTRLWFKWLS